MFRITLLAVATLLAAPAFADPPRTDLQSANAFPAAADKVYPPLPTLAMLPPSSGSDDDLPVKPASHRKKSHVPIQMQERRGPPMPAVRLVVSDASHAYLDSVQRQIDQALVK
ncbi:hypothetical protein R69927_04846 [Paraburkholderia domus]|jgi:hypothetical protein|uniref:Uncharacterized protein n=1 Tax=Paraburkholderia domus TaxID=2793075 RepID=A0A9N8N325_9BURK|nr:hypothetical protein [Paraburkholderia domus]CAE6715947.1 hypothetical protein R70006_01442 [Paraburkholderia domus]CAE6758580.1 hypothetical protein R75483_03452 [Paraburkholderia domus]CAE6833313.1 hypothetical protein R69749_04110 [Paraburkholderia domus]CAE6867744.1 hypothetical protein R70199_01351 [Paraburkholderia domus]CAE6876290.1 hypothetical protein R75471_01439 [Paraburkholderia domus]